MEAGLVRSSNMSPVISLDARYVSLDLHSCDTEGSIDVIDIRSIKQVQLDHASCKKIFNYP